jgi:hypothetical protein
MSMARLFRLGGSGPMLGVGQGTLLGVTLLAAVSLPFSPGHLAQLEALNRELGKLCGGNPPKQALTVCRLHAKLVGAL